MTAFENDAKENVVGFYNFAIFQKKIQRAHILCTTKIVHYQAKILKFDSKLYLDNISNGDSRLTVLNPPQKLPTLYEVH